MPTKEKTPESNKDNQMIREASQKSEKTVFKEIKNTNLNTSFESPKNQDQTLKKDQKHQQKQQFFQTKELQKQKAEVLETLKSIEKQQKLIKNLIQKSTEKLPNIRNSSSDKQNHNTNSRKKSSVVSLHRPRNENNESTIIQKSRKPHVTEINYSIVNGKKLYMSEEDVKKLKKLKIQYKKREQQIKKRVVIHDRQVQKMKTDQLMSKEKKLEAKREQRMKSIQQKQKTFEKERQQKLQRFKEENKKLKELKKSKKLFQKMEQQYQVLEQHQKSRIDQMIKSKVEQVKISFDQINQHEKNYLGKKEQIIENSRVRIHSKLKELEQEFSHLNLHKSKFYEKAKCEKKQMQQEIQENQRKRKAYSEKIQEYKLIVKENYMPKVVIVLKEEENKLPTYNISEIHNIGNQYMKQGTKLIDRNKSLILLQKMKNEETEKNRRKIYKNYLHENNLQNVPLQKSKSHSKLMETQIDKQLKTINSMKSPKEKYEKIKMLQSKIQRDLKPTLSTGGKIKLMTRNKQLDVQSQVQINQIAVKIKLLQGLQEAPLQQVKINKQF